MTTEDNKKEEKKYFYVDCRGTIVRVLTKYLERIDLFRNMYELSNEMKFQLDDFSPEEFNNYINVLRDNGDIPNNLKTIWNYLNTDCEKRNKENEEDKKLLNTIKEELNKLSGLPDDNIMFVCETKFTQKFYDKYKEQIDKYISDSPYGSTRKNFKIMFDKCEKHPYIVYWKYKETGQIALNQASKMKCILC
jgi:hypothetical protein